jgi:hypothetical protein
MARTARIKRHIVVSIEGALATAARGDETVLALLDAPDFATLKKDLEEMKADGWEVVRSENCDNYDYAGNCLGHKSWEAEKDGKE